jgi:hypothetical protein
MGPSLAMRLDYAATLLCASYFRIDVFVKLRHGCPGKTTRHGALHERRPEHFVLEDRAARLIESQKAPGIFS